MSITISQKQISDLKNKISQALRTEQSNIQKIKYVEIKENKATLLQQNNYVVWGRRGSGKTTLLLISFYESYNDKKLPIFIDSKLYKNHSYPDLLIKFLITIFEDIDNTFIKKGIKGFFHKKVFEKEINDLKHQLSKHNDKTEILRNESSTSLNSAGVDIQAESVGKISSVSQSEKAITESYSYSDDKIQFLEKNMDKYQKNIKKAMKTCGREEMIIFIDDYYYIHLKDQPFIIDYIHRLLYDTNGWLKIASNRYSSKLYERTKEGDRIGLTEGEDCLSIDLDFTLVKFKDTERFLKDIIKNHAEAVGIMHIEDLFSPNAFTRLVWCSGGVPRDFLNLMILILNRLDENTKIGVYLINESAQDYYENKLSNIESEYEQVNQIKELFDKLFYLCIEKYKTTGFIIENVTNALHEQKAFKDLIDNRLIHLIEKNISAKAYSGKRFNGYILSVGSYAKLLRLKNNKQPHEINIIKDPQRPIDSEIRSIAPAISDKEIEQLDLKNVTFTATPIKIKKIKKEVHDNDLNTNALLKWT